MRCYIINADDLIVSPRMSAQPVSPAEGSVCGGLRQRAPSSPVIAPMTPSTALLQTLSVTSRSRKHQPRERGMSENRTPSRQRGRLAGTRRSPGDSGWSSPVEPSAPLPSGLEGAARAPEGGARAPAALPAEECGR